MQNNNFLSPEIRNQGGNFSLYVIYVTIYVKVSIHGDFRVNKKHENIGINISANYTMFQNDFNIL